MPGVKPNPGHPPTKPVKPVKRNKRKAVAAAPVPRNAVVWNDELCEKMLSIIIEDDKLHNGLFPGPGTTQEDGTGSNKLPKSEFEWLIASRLFGNGQYADVFAQSTTTPAGRTQWTMKIKNRLTQMHRIVDACSEMMGETGQGIKCEDDIDMDRDNSLTRSWAEVKKKCPWYFTLKGLISERPNVVPVGLGNNTAEYDTSILVGQGNNEAGPSNAGVDLFDSDELNDTAEDQKLEEDLNLLNTDAINPPSPDVKAATREKKVPIKKEGTVPAKRKSPMDRIAETEVARLDCKKVKFETEQHRLKTVENVALARAQEKTRRAVEIRQAELSVEKDAMWMNHEFRMEMLRHDRVPPPSSQDPQLSTSLRDFPPYPGTWKSLTSSPAFQPYAASQPNTAPQPSAPFEVPPFKSFPRPSPDYSGSDRHESPVPRSDLSDKTAADLA